MPEQPASPDRDYSDAHKDLGYVPADPETTARILQLRQEESWRSGLRAARQALTGQSPDQTEVPSEQPPVTPDSDLPASPPAPDGSADSGQRG